MAAIEQVVPHFHLPLQSGSDPILRRMNRQYTRGDFLRMIDRVHATYDRPAITTDIIVGFPGEMDVEFAQTLDIVNRVRFIHTHAFSFSPRPGTAAARWQKDFVRGPIVNQRIDLLNELARQGELGGHLVSGDYVRFVDGPKDIEEIGAELTSAGFAWRRPMRPRIA